MNTEPLDADTLIRQAKSGDVDALGQLLEAHRNYLRRCARWHVNGPLSRRIDVSDIVQITCLDVPAGIVGFKGSTELEFKRWLFAICSLKARKLIAHHTAAKRDMSREIYTNQDDSENSAQPDVIAILSTPAQILVREEGELALWEAVGSLTEREQEAIRGRYVLALPIAEIAQQLECSYDAVVRLMTRALRKLRKAMNHTA